MTPQIISLIVTGLAVLLILIQVLVGAIRGLKKSTFRLIWVFAWGIVCIIAATLIAKALVNFDISFLHLKANGVEVSTLPQYVEKTLEASNPDIATMIADNPKILELCTSIASMVLSLVLFEVLFWVTKLIFWPIWAILSHVFFGRKKKDKKDENGKKLPKPKKHAGFGALVGLGLGLIVCMFTFVPLHFINSAVMLVEAETTTEQSDGTNKGLLSQALGDNAKYITVYEDSYVAKAFKYTGISFVQDLISDALTSVNFQGQRISLSNEVSTFAPIYKDYTKISSYDFSNLSKADITELLLIADDAQSRVLSSNLVKSVYNELAPYLAKNIITNPSYFIHFPDFQNEYLNTIVKDTLKAFFGINELGEIDENKVIKIEDIKSDISKVIDIASTLNQTNLIVDTINGDLSFDKIQLEITTDLGNSLVDKFFELKTISTLVPVIVEPSIKYGIESIPSLDINGEEVKIVYTAKADDISVDNLKTFLKGIVGNSIQIIKDVDTTSMLYVSSASLKNVGAILDSLKSGNVISLDTYNSIFNYGTKYANNIIDENYPNQNPDDPEDTEYKDSINVVGKTLISAINDIHNSTTSNFELEFVKLQNMFNFASTLLQSADVQTEIIKTENLVQVGKNLDELISNGSLIFSKSNCETILTALLDKFNLGDYEKYKAQVKTNISNITSYEDEILAVTKLLNIKDIETEDRQKFVDIGKVLDEVKASKLIGNLIKPIMSDFIDEVMEGITIDSSIISAIETIKNNISTELVFENELGYVYDILNAEINDINSLEIYLQTSLLNTDGSSKSELITIDVLYDAAISFVQTINIIDVDITNDIKNQLEADKAAKINILDVITQVKSVQSKTFDTSKNVDDMDSTYIINLGQQIDNLAIEYNLILNQTAIDKIGYKVAKIINDKVQEKTELGSKLAQLQDIYDSRENKTLYPNFEALFTAYANKLYE